MRSASIAFGDDCTSTVCVRPSAGLPVNVLANGKSSVPTWLATTSSLFSASPFSDRSVGRMRGPAPLAYVRSATTLPISIP
jgi:hypothetical protein